MQPVSVCLSFIAILLLAMGSVWATPVDTNTSHWSFQPRQTISVPEVKSRDWVRDPIDAFILARLEKASLAPTELASARVLGRRLYMDLIGLFPSVAELDAFEVDVAERGQSAVESLVDTLLASPHYGERWGRHWLDVARYAESNGDDGLGRNATFPHAWRYRDYVIQAFNRDVPYNRFLTEQIAGDLLPADTVEEQNRLKVATGFLAIGHKPAAAMNSNFAMDVVDDQIDVIGTAVMGMSLACARCHDHKHDPISARDYYALAGIFTSTEILYGKAANEKLTAPATPLHELHDQFQQPDPPGVTHLTLPDSWGRAIRKRSPVLYESLTTRPDSLTVSDKITWSAKTFAEVKQGFLKAEFSGLTPDYTVAFWFRNTLKNNARPITAYLFSRAADGNKSLPGDHLGIGGTHDKNRTGRLFVFNGNVKKQSVGGSTSIPPNSWNHVVMIRSGKRVRVILNGQTRAEIDAELSPTFGRNPQFVLASRSDAFAPLQGNIGEVAVWNRAIGPDDARTLYLASQLPPGPDARPATERLAMGVRDKPKPAASLFYKNGITPEKNNRIPRGFPVMYQQVWKPAPTLPDNQSGRLQLANWLTDPGHPQTARVIVNRIWLHLHGRPLVDTPDDFGIYGAQPTHPALLDYLANRFITEGWSFKRFIRAVVLSRSYQLASQASARHLAIDPANRLYARHLRRRLDAESLRDHILRASGQLDLSPGQGSVIQDRDQLINWPPGKATNLHQPSAHRSIYLCYLRHSPPPGVASFDLPDGTCTLGHRETSILPTHGLFLLNSPVVVEPSRHLAAHLLSIEADSSRRISLAYRRTLLREPSAKEKRESHRLVTALRAELGAEDAIGPWSGLIQALFACNEFNTID